MSNDYLYKGVEVDVTVPLTLDRTSGVVKFV